MENKNDSIVKNKIGKKLLIMRKSHKLPFYYENFPFYDRALPRICKDILLVDGYLKVIDVGANIGDTVSLITDEVDGCFLCIEGDVEYLPFLKKNLENIKGSRIFIEESYCAKNNRYEESLKIERFDGTAKLVKNEKGHTPKGIRFKSLDEIVKKNKFFNNANLLKIDTDGFEVEVLMGGEKLLDEARPIIYFEFVPELYLNNKHDPMFIFNFLRNKGYKKALFYDNFGFPIEIIDIYDKKKIQYLISLIDNNKIYYYDILVWHDFFNDKYKRIINKEIMFFRKNND